MIVVLDLCDCRQGSRRQGAREREVAEHEQGYPMETKVLGGVSNRRRSCRETIGGVLETRYFMCCTWIVRGHLWLQKP